MNIPTSGSSARSRLRARTVMPSCITSGSVRGWKTCSSHGESPGTIGIFEFENWAERIKIGDVRLMKKTQWADGIEVRPSTIDGKGTFAAKPFKKGRKIAEFVGERISRVEVARRLRGKRRIRICGVDSY